MEGVEFNERTSAQSVLEKLCVGSHISLNGIPDIVIDEIPGVPSITLLSVRSFKDHKIIIV